METQVDIRLSRALMDASIICPAPLCGYHCRCTGYVPGELATFHCRHCELTYYLGLGHSPILRTESTAPKSGVA